MNLTMLNKTCLKLTHILFLSRKNIFNFDFSIHLKAFGLGKEPQILCLDLTCESYIIKLKINELIRKFKRIDILINNAGVNYRGEVKKLLVFFRNLHLNSNGLINRALQQKKKFYAV